MKGFVRVFGENMQSEKTAKQKNRQKKYLDEMRVTRVSNRWSSQNTQDESIDRESTVVIHHQVPESMILRKQKDICFSSHAKWVILFFQKAPQGHDIQRWR